MLNFFSYQLIIHIFFFYSNIFFKWGHFVPGTLCSRGRFVVGTLCGGDALCRGRFVAGTDCSGTLRGGTDCGGDAMWRDAL